MRKLFLVGIALLSFALAAGACGGDGGAAPTAPAGPTPFPARSSAPIVPKRLGTLANTAVTIRDPAFEPLAGAKPLWGTLGKAAYRIEVPANWNGDLVLYAHGIRLLGSEVFVSNPLGPLRSLFISGGFAWAASSYTENFYVPGQGADDSIALIQQFEKEVGRPNRIFVVGESMGGNVVTLLMENYPGVFDGGLAVCGALTGADVPDFFISWAMAAEFVSGVKLPVGGGQAAMALTVLTRIPGALGNAEALTEKGRQFRGIIRELTGGPRPFFAEGFALQYQQNFGLLLLDPDRQTVPIAAATNREARYSISPGLGLTSEQVNAGIRRLDADPAARNATAHPDAVPTTGRIERPLLTLHNTGDLFVPIGEEARYRQRVEAAGKGGLLIQRAIREGGHCKFSDQEYATAWNDLVTWVRTGIRPAGDDLTGSLAEIGLQFTNPLRPGDPGTR